MSSFYDTVAAILKTTPPIHTFLEGCNRYYAHVSPKNAVHPLPPETLQEHIELVLEKLSLIVSQHGLDTVIDNLILDFLKVHNLQNDLKLGQFIKRLFVNTIVFHDFGKVNENFQASYRKMNNAYFKGKENRQSVLSTRHSGLGAYLFIVKSISEAKEKLGPKSQAVVMATILMFAYPIFKHHSKYLNDEYIDTISFSPEEVNCMKRYISHYQFNIHQQFVEILPAHLKKAFKDLQGAEVFNSFSLYSLVKLNFSLLTASDYLATSQYMSGNKLVVNDLGVLTVERILQIFDFVSKSEFLNAPHLKKRNYNRETYEKINEGFKLENPKTVGNDHLNKLRQEMAFEVILNVRKNSYKNLFYIEAPTGGGKTNLSMLAVVELLKANEGRINKVFYVFPFTTLITQTYTTIKETLGLRDSEIIQLHSKAGYKEKEEKGEEEKEDGLYSDEKENYIHNLFTHYPFSLLSHIKFFDLLKTNEKEANYLLHRIANSIVVIDELQSYDPAHWDKIIYFITQYAQLYNIRFVLMSATLPKLGDLKVLERPYTEEFVYLLPNAKQDYFLNPNFSERVKFNFDLFERQNLTLTEIAEKVLAESQKYALLDFGTLKPANSVYCIIEFIFKKTATDFYQIVEGLNNSFFDEILVLSGTILEHRRKEIINLLKSPEARRKKILLITTQVVEAGVDIDMDLGFKDRSMVDSEEQLAGRINRNVNKRDCILFLFNYNKENIIYGQDLRYQETKKIKPEDYKQILQQKDFDFLYNSIFCKIDYWAMSDTISNHNHNKQLKCYIPKIQSLKFASVHDEFKLIERENISCFIPVEVPVTVEGINNKLKDDVFLKNEIDFLELHGIVPTENNMIRGTEVFDLYISFIQNKRDFTEQKIGNKMLQGILSKFIISLFGNKNVETQITLYSDEEKSKYGYKYVERWKDFYDIRLGMDAERFSSNETQFL